MTKVKKYTIEEVNAVKVWLIGNRNSVFGIVYDYMLSKGKDPFGKDIDEFFTKAKEYVALKNNKDMKK
jgi:hypothetical protein